MRRLLTALFTIAATSLAAHAQAPVSWRDKVSSFMAANMQHTAWGVSHGDRDYHLAL